MATPGLQVPIPVEVRELKPVISGVTLDSNTPIIQCLTSTLAESTTAAFRRISSQGTFEAQAWSGEHTDAWMPAEDQGFDQQMLVGSAANEDDVPLELVFKNASEKPGGTKPEVGFMPPLLYLTDPHAPALVEHKTASSPVEWVYHPGSLVHFTYPESPAAVFHEEHCVERETASSPVEWLNDDHSASKAMPPLLYLMRPESPALVEREEHNDRKTTSSPIDWGHGASELMPPLLYFIRPESPVLVAHEEQCDRNTTSSPVDWAGHDDAQEMVSQTQQQIPPHSYDAIMPQHLHGSEISSFICRDSAGHMFKSEAWSGEHKEMPMPPLSEEYEAQVASAEENTKPQEGDLPAMIYLPLDPAREQSGIQPTCVTDEAHAAPGQFEAKTWSGEHNIQLPPPATEIQCGGLEDTSKPGKDPFVPALIYLPLDPTKEDSRPHATMLPHEAHSGPHSGQAEIQHKEAKSDPHVPAMIYLPLDPTKEDSRPHTTMLPHEAHSGLHSSQPESQHKEIKTDSHVPAMIYLPLDPTKEDSRPHATMLPHEAHSGLHSSQPESQHKEIKTDSHVPAMIYLPLDPTKEDSQPHATMLLHEAHSGLHSGLPESEHKQIKTDPHVPAMIYLPLDPAKEDSRPHTTVLPHGAHSGFNSGQPESEHKEIKTDPHVPAMIYLPLDPAKIDNRPHATILPHEAHSGAHSAQSGKPHMEIKSQCTHTYGQQAVQHSSDKLVPEISTMATGYLPVIQGISHGEVIMGNVTKHVISGYEVMPVAIPTDDPLSRLQAQLKELESSVGQAAVGMSAMVQDAIGQHGPGAEMQVQVSSQRQCQSRKMVFETTAPPGVEPSHETALAMQAQALEQLHKAGAVSFPPTQYGDGKSKTPPTSPGRSFDDEMKTQQQRESMEEGYIDESGNIVVSKKVTRIVTTTRTAYEGSDEPVAEVVKTVDKVESSVDPDH